MFAPMVNPYESSMTKAETSRTWENWTQRRKVNYYLARRFPKLLSYFYRRTFLSGRHGPIDNWLSLTLGKRVISIPFFSLFSFELLLPPAPACMRGNFKELCGNRELSQRVYFRKIRHCPTFITLFLGIPLQWRSNA